MTRFLSVSLLALTLSACAGTWESPSGDHSRNVLTAEEIGEIQALNAFEAVQRLRPEFLRRGRVNMRADTKQFPIVYVDNLRWGEIGELRRIRASEVLRIRYLSGSDATMRFGTGHAGGALLVTTSGSGE